MFLRLAGNCAPTSPSRHARLHCHDMSKTGPGAKKWDQLVVHNAVREITQHDEVGAWRHHIFDVRGFHDPYNAQYRRHCGYHWGIITGLGQQTAEVDRLLRQVCSVLTARHPCKTLLVFICRSGRHRAVAWACIFDRLLRLWGCPAEYSMSELYYAKTDYHQIGCRCCYECSRVDDKREDAIDVVGRRWQQLFPNR